MNKFLHLTGQSYLPPEKRPALSISQLIDNIAAFQGDDVIAIADFDRAPIVRSNGTYIVIHDNGDHLKRNSILRMLRDMSLPDNHVPIFVRRGNNEIQYYTAIGADANDPELLKIVLMRVG